MPGPRPYLLGIFGTTAKPDCFRAIDQSHQSPSAPFPYTTKHNQLRCPHICSEWRIVGNRTGALSDWWIWSIWELTWEIGVVWYLFSHAFGEFPMKYDKFDVYTFGFLMIDKYDAMPLRGTLNRCIEVTFEAKVSKIHVRILQRLAIN